MHGMSGITVQEKCGSILLVLGPHADDLDRLLLCINLIDEAMLNIDPAGERSRQIADELFVGWRILEGVVGQNIEKTGRLRFEI